MCGWIMKLKISYSDIFRLYYVKGFLALHEHNAFYTYMYIICIKHKPTL